MHIANVMFAGVRPLSQSFYYVDDCTHWPCVSFRHTIELINPGISHTTIHNFILVTPTSFDPHVAGNNTGRYSALSYCRIAILFTIMVDVIHDGDRREHSFGTWEALRAEVSSAPPQPSATANSNMHHMHRPACHQSKLQHLLPVLVRCRASLDPRDLILNPICIMHMRNLRRQPVTPEFTY